jgi:hypothetical protein
MKVGAKVSLEFRVKNLGGSPWPARGRDDGRFQVNLADQWVDMKSGRVLNNMDGRTALPGDLAPGAEARLALVVTAPEWPGKYLLEIDLVHEGVTWFHEKGSQTLKLPIIRHSE